MKADKLREQLAAIEHQRWAHWQHYMHDQCNQLPDGRLAIPADKVERWFRQCETPYEDLSEVEKDSDREQVDRVWHIIEALRANYEDELERVRVTMREHIAAKHQLGAKVAQQQRDLDRANENLSTLANWLLQRLTLDKEIKQRLSQDPEYVVAFAVEMLEKALQGVQAIWPVLLEKLQPVLMASLFEVLTEGEIDDAEAGRAVRAGSPTGTGWPAGPNRGVDAAV